MSKTEEALLPCDYCHSKDVSMCFSMRGADEPRHHHVVCNSCLASGPYKETEIEAIKAWNTRTPEGQEMWGVENEKGFQNVCFFQDSAELQATRSQKTLPSQGPYKVVPVIVTKKED